jgi:hypothetical protein
MNGVETAHQIGTPLSSLIGLEYSLTIKIYYQKVENNETPKP